MEKAIHITSLANLKYLQQGRYERLYWGSEFCQNLIPTLKDTEKILDIVDKRKLGFTFVTPFVTERGLANLKKIFLWLEKKSISCEIVVNDWGVLECLDTEFNGYLPISLGRLLVRQQRDPAVKKILEKQPPFAMRNKDGKISIIVHKLPSKRYRDGIKSSYINSSVIQNLLSKFGIKRVELNNVIQGLNLDKSIFKKSIYTPYVNISTTRFCPMNTRFQKIYRINVCNKECQRYYEILRNKSIPKVIYRRGNTTFCKNPLNIKSIITDTIDRIVFQPEIPF